MNGYVDVSFLQASGHAKEPSRYSADVILLTIVGEGDSHLNRRLIFVILGSINGIRGARSPLIYRVLGLLMVLRLGARSGSWQPRAAQSRPRLSADSLILAFAYSG